MKYRAILFFCLSLLLSAAGALAQDLLVVDVQFSGATIFDDKQLRRLASIRPGDPASKENLERAVERIKRGYRRDGYPSARVKWMLEPREGTPRTVVSVSIEEGSLVRISQVELDSPLPEDVAKLKRQLIDRAVGAAASARNRRILRLELLSALRKEGYLQASVEIPEFEFKDLSEGATLKVSIDAHEPITIEFVGNKLFSPAELLRPLKLETRSVPFTPSALRRLIEEIVALYQAHGYYNASAYLEELEGDETRREFRITIKEGPQMHLKSIVFHGNRSIPAAELLAILETQVEDRWLFGSFSPRYLQDRLIAADVNRLIGHYQQAGFEMMKVRSQVSQTDPEEHELLLEFFIEEGPQSLISDYHIDWEDGRPDALDLVKLQALRNPLIDAPASPDRLEDARKSLETLVRDLGYDSAQVQADYRRETGALRLHVIAGQKLKIAAVHVKGLVYTHESVVRRVFALYPGMNVRTSDLRKAEQSLYRLGVFQKVTVSVVPSDQGPLMRDVVIDLFERDTGTLDLGLTFDSEDGVHVLGELGQRNLAGTGNSLILSVNGSKKAGGNLLDAGTARALFLVPQNEAPDFLAEAFAQYSIQLFNPYHFDKEGLSLALRSSQERHLRGTARWTVFQERVYDVLPDVDIGPNDFGTTLYSFIRGEAEYDKRDDFANPRRGFRFREETQVASKYWGSNVDLRSFRTSAVSYLPLSPRIVWTNRVVQTTVRGFGSTDVVPLSQRVFLGGKDSLRGFSRYQVGPRGSENNVLGGDTAYEYSTEGQYQLLEDVIGVLFFDTGVSVLRQKGEFEGDGLALSTSDLSMSPGFGVRYKTPIGPIRLELGFALDRKFGERPVRAILAVGNSF